MWLLQMNLLGLIVIYFVSMPSTFLMHLNSLLINKNATYVLHMRGAVSFKNILCRFVMSSIGPAAAMLNEYILVSFVFGFYIATAVYTCTHGACCHSDRHDVSCFWIVVSVRSNSLVQKTAPRDTDTDIDTMDATEDPKMIVFHELQRML